MLGEAGPICPPPTTGAPDSSTARTGAQRIHCALSHLGNETDERTLFIPSELNTRPGDLCVNISPVQPECRL